MKKVVKKQPKTLEAKVDNLSSAVSTLSRNVDKLAEMMLKGFARVDARFEDIEKRMATKADILELHDKFIHRREFDQLSLRVSKLEAKSRR